MCAYNENAIRLNVIRLNNYWSDKIMGFLKTFKMSALWNVSPGISIHKKHLNYLNILCKINCSSLETNDTLKNFKLIKINNGTNWG